MDAAIYSAGDAYGLADAGFGFGGPWGGGPWGTMRRQDATLNLGSVRPRFAAPPAFGTSHTLGAAPMHFRPVLVRRSPRFGAAGYYTDDAGFSLGGMLKSAVKAVGSVVKAVPLVGTGLKVVSNLGSGIVHGDFSKVKEALTHDPIGRFIGGAVSGENLGKAAMAAAKAGVKDAGEAIRLAAMVAPMVPGIGSGVAAAIGAANALASGQRIDQALMSAARSAIPGGPLAQAAFDVAVKAAQGGNVLDAGLGAVRAQLPGGPAAKAAFDAALALAHGKKLQDVAIQAGAALLPPSPYSAAALDFVRGVASGKPLAAAALSTAGNAIMSQVPNIMGTAAKAVGAAVGAPSGAAFDPGAIVQHVQSATQAARAAYSALAGGGPGGRPEPLQLLGAALKFGGGGGGTSLLPSNVSQVAAALVNRPELRSLPIESVARDLGVPLGDARQAAASLAQSIARVGQSGNPTLAPAPALEARISGAQSVDQVLSDLGSNAAPIATSPSPSYGAIPTFIPHPAALASVLDVLPHLRSHPTIGAWMRLAGAGQVDARGLDPSGGTSGAGRTASPAAVQWFWLVDPGTWPAKVAQLVTGDANRWPEFTRANPQVPKDSSGNFTRFYPGDRLRLPLTWNQYVYADGSGVSGGAPLPAPAPVPSVIPPTPQQPPSAGNYANTLPTGGIAFVKAQLGKWGVQTGAINPKGYPGPFDINPAQPDAIDAPFSSAVASFQAWANANMKAGLRTDGVLDANTHATLNAYDAGNRVPGVPASTPAIPQLPPAVPPLGAPPALPGVPAVPGAPPPVPPLVAQPSTGVPTFPAGPGVVGGQTQAQKSSGGGALPLLMAAAYFAFA